MKRALNIAAKDVRLLVRDKAALFWAFGFPIMFALLFGFAFSGLSGKPRDIPIALVDGDQSTLSKAFATQLGKSTTLKVTALSEPNARQQVRRGNQSAMVILRKGFGATLAGFLPTETSSTAPVIELNTDPAKRLEAGVLQGVLIQARLETLQGMLSDETFRHEIMNRAEQRVAQYSSKMPPELAKNLGDLAKLGQRYTTGPLAQLAWSAALPAGATTTSTIAQMFAIPETAVSNVRNAQWTSYFQVAFPQSIIWGILGCVSSFAIMLVQERSSGTLQRLRVSGVSLFEVLAGKGLACFITALSMVGVLAILGRVVFHLTPNNGALLLMGAVCLAASFVGVMLFASTLGNTERAVAGAGWAMFLLMGMFGGSMVPLVMMPPWMQTLSHISPVRWGILAIEGAYWRKFSFEDMLLPCGLLIGFGLLFLGAAFVVSRRRPN